MSRCWGLLFLAAFTLVGCSTATAGSASPATSATQLSQADREDLFIVELDLKGFPYASSARAESLGYGWALCHAFARGVTREELDALPVSPPLTKGDVAVAIVAAANDLCPEYVGRL